MQHSIQRVLDQTNASLPSSIGEIVASLMFSNVMEAISLLPHTGRIK